MTDQKIRGTHKNYLLKVFPRPSWVPNIHDVVIHNETGKRVLVLMTPHDPIELNEIPPGTKARPCVCDILLGEETIYDIDISMLSPVKKSQTK